MIWMIDMKRESIRFMVVRLHGPVLRVPLAASWADIQRILRASHVAGAKDIWVICSCINAHLYQGEEWLPLPLDRKQFKLQSPVILHRTEVVMGGKNLPDCPLELTTSLWFSVEGHQNRCYFLNRNLSPLYIHWKFRQQNLHTFFQTGSIYSKFFKTF